MASQADIDEPPPPRRGRRLGYAALAVLAILAMAFAVLWVNRERIADNVIADQLESYGIDATYKIERIGGRRQVLTDIVVGDRHRPDLTVERAEVAIRYRFGAQELAGLRRFLDAAARLGLVPSAFDLRIAFSSEARCGV